MSVMSTDASGTPTRSKYDRLIAAAQKVPAVPTLVVHPCDESSLRGAVDAAEAGIIKPILVGPAAKVRDTAAKHSLNIAGYEIVDAPHSEAAAAKAVEMIHAGKGEALMKGSLHTDELMRSVTAKVGGLRTDRRISHVFIMDVPAYADTLFVTDAAINIFPDLDGKRDIIQNAVDLYNQAGFGTTPRVAILSAVETVTSKIPSTIEAAALCKMADRGQITGAMLDGPLAFDNAIDMEAARIKGIKSEVAGRAQILIVPDLESGNMLAKNLAYFAKADGAGIVLGARVPVVLTSRADSPRARMASAAVAALYANARRRRRRSLPRDRHGYDPRRQCRLLQREVPGLRGGRRGRIAAADQGPDGRDRQPSAIARQRLDRRTADSEARLVILVGYCTGFRYRTFRSNAAIVTFPS